MERNAIAVFVAVFLLLLAALYVYDITIGAGITGMVTAGNEDYLSLEGYVPVEVYVKPGNVVGIKSGCYVIENNVLEGQALSIYNALNDITYFRPLTHDLMSDIFDLLDIKVRVAKISKYKDGVYYARLIVEQGDKVLDLDARPSDVIAIALREGVDVYIKKDILEKTGVNVC